MTANTENGTETSGPPESSRVTTLLVVGSFVFILVVLLYMERIPGFLHWPVRILFAAAVIWLAYAAFRTVRKINFEVKKVVFSLILVVLGYGAIYLICMVFVQLMGKKDEHLTTVDTSGLSDNSRRGIEAMLEEDSLSIYDREVGWVSRPGYLWKGRYQVNDQGLRGALYPETAPDPEKRVLCLGDSFTFGYEVDDDQTWPSHAEQQLPGTEWVNLGINGVGLTQFLLHYRKTGKKFGGKYVVIAFMTNNIKRSVNCFRPFVSPNDMATPLTKPFAQLKDGKFSIEPNPYQDISDYRGLLANESGEMEGLHQLDFLTWSNQQVSTNPIVRTIRFLRDHRNIDRNLDVLLGRPVDESFGRFNPDDDPYGKAIWHPKSPGFQANAQLFDLIYNEVIADGRVPLIVILPSAVDVEHRSEGRRPKHAALLKHFERKGYRFFDFLDVLEEHHGENLKKENVFVKTHPNGEAHRLLAEKIIEMFGLR